MESFLATASDRQIRDLMSRTNELVASKPSKFALAQMKKMGWKEGKGLGRREDGIVDHVSTDKRDESQGLGFKHEDYDRWGQQWWHEHYNSTASAIGGDAMVSLSDVSDSSEDEEEATGVKTPATTGSGAPTDEELFRACGGRRCGMRARAAQPGKWARVEGGTPFVYTPTPRDGTDEAGGAVDAKDVVSAGKGESGTESGDGAGGKKRKEKKRKEKRQQEGAKKAEKKKKKSKNKVGAKRGEDEGNVPDDGAKESEARTPGTSKKTKKRKAEKDEGQRKRKRTEAAPSPAEEVKDATKSVRKEKKAKKKKERKSGQA
mmetsp:Transcript_30955/g.100896  ORF Transcript_30955/g.100896 Transcript_30955/m.100896 type:complete len:318 (-) Transcript_30955:55-1008(-)|eukprot:CAMPEP_0196772584 /NCGR_PEP_ID=MMETSP1104-20130614/2308_1 /TAXON_ID=33652 /ORGANISM="Cafeteria sp., Strain Caron Lab Isolate" /LENGTH=317 /DNA_ID=CAMNT_0042142721 /DNA_START=1 /DNA_END=954 /DNA_ORIENTATION=+